MKYWTGTALIVMIVMALGACKMSKNSAEQVAIETEVDSVSYGLGVNIAKSFADQGADSLNTELIAQGMRDYMDENKTPKWDPEKNKTIINNYMVRKQEEMNQKNKEKGEQFLEENAEKEGVVELPSGLQYKVIEMGDGPKPKATSTVKAHYHGTLIDGTVFDSSVDRGKPLEIPVNKVIKGWTEALQMMPVGSKWELYIPYDLAYGSRQQPGSPIKPYSTLIFEVELLEIVK